MYLHPVVFNIIMVHGHEEDVDHDTEGDKELSKGVEHNDRQDLGCPDPEPTTVPYTHHIRSLFNAIKNNIFHFGTLIVIILEKVK